jgi:hypothetical protein
VLVHVGEVLSGVYGRESAHPSLDDLSTRVEVAQASAIGIGGDYQGIVDNRFCVEIVRVLCVMINFVLLRSSVRVRPSIWVLE